VGSVAAERQRAIRPVLREGMLWRAVWRACGRMAGCAGCRRSTLTWLMPVLCPLLLCCAVLCCARLCCVVLCCSAATLVLSRNLSCLSLSHSSSSYNSSQRTLLSPPANTGPQQPASTPDSQCPTITHTWQQTLQ
jgi:hypothetical protein